MDAQPNTPYEVQVQELTSKLRQALKYQRINYEISIQHQENFKRIVSNLNLIANALSERLNITVFPEPLQVAENPSLFSLKAENDVALRNEIRGKPTTVVSKTTTTKASRGADGVGDDGSQSGGIEDALVPSQHWARISSVALSKPSGVKTPSAGPSSLSLHSTIMQFKDDLSSQELHDSLLNITEDDFKTLNEDSVSAILPLVPKWLASPEQKHQLTAVVILHESIKPFPFVFVTCPKNIQNLCKHGLEKLSTNKDFVEQLQTASIDIKAIMEAFVT